MSNIFDKFKKYNKEGELFRKIVTAYEKLTENMRNE